MWTFPVGPLFKQNRIGMEFVDGPDKKREAARDALAQRYY
jgi:hypothetical protein